MMILDSAGSVWMATLIPKAYQPAAATPVASSRTPSATDAAIAILLTLSLRAYEPTGAPHAPQVSEPGLLWWPQARHFSSFGGGAVITGGATNGIGACATPTAVKFLACVDPADATRGRTTV